MVKQYSIPVCLWLLLLHTYTAQAQQNDTLTIEACYTRAEENYPLIKQRDLVLKSKEYSIDNVMKGYLPQFSINGQATYQSAVTQVPIALPGAEAPQLSKDQYKLYAEVNQTIYDGGAIRHQKYAHEVNAKVEEQKLAVELYTLKERINQLYFGILTTDEQLRQNELLQNDLQLGIRKTQASIDNGIAFKSNADALKAELLKANQRTTELEATRLAYLQMLGLFINQSLNENTVLARPQQLAISNEITRPELSLYDCQNKSIDVQYQQLQVKNNPKLNLFVQGGYGRPALNMLSNDFEAYYIGGVRLSWSLGGIYTLKKEKALLENSRRTINLQRETFLFNTNLTSRQQHADITRLQQLLASDGEIITLRESVKKASAAQLENGVITSNDYLREVNAEDQARQTKILHEIQWLLAQYNHQTTTGGLSDN
ncbi:TolC family protein [Ohtaekwangia kribbensis]|jgi:outer membrane protein TolC|uniref:TolC family protein n=1 Tax=Ohtaekwangia kribbensis TaxID=688913 RepID=A0ABW3K615_9BACT